MNDHLSALQLDVAEAVNRAVDGQVTVSVELLERVLKLPPLIDDMLTFVAEQLKMPETKQAIEERIERNASA